MSNLSKFFSNSRFLKIFCFALIVNVLLFFLVFLLSFLALFLLIDLSIDNDNDLSNIGKSGKRPANAKMQIWPRWPGACPGVARACGVEKAWQSPTFWCWEMRTDFCSASVTFPLATRQHHSNLYGRIERFVRFYACLMRSQRRLFVVACCAMRSCNILVQCARVLRPWVLALHAT